MSDLLPHSEPQRGHRIQPDPQIPTTPMVGPKGAVFQPVCVEWRTDGSGISATRVEVGGRWRLALSPVVMWVRPSTGRRGSMSVGEWRERIRDGRLRPVEEA